MKSPRHQLILLGLLCQGLSWDNYFLPLINGLFWIAALNFPKKPWRTSPLAECALLVAGGGIAFLLAPVLGKSNHFFIGHGLTLLQLSRLPSILTRREKIFSVVIAFFQLGVGCTVILDYRFILILAFAVFLIPKSFLELELEPFLRPSSTSAGKNHSQVSPRVGLLPYLGIAGAMALFFVLFPRGFFTGPLPVRLAPGGDQGTLADSILDASRGGLQQSSRVLLQIQGESVGYLRCFALIDFDGLRWTRDPAPATRRIEYVPPGKIGEYAHRRVRVKNIAFLGRVLPTDGRVVQLNGKFFRSPRQNTHGAIECEAIWNTSNNVYEYWINPKPKPEGLYPGLVDRYSRVPSQSQRVATWLDSMLEGITDPLQQARHLEQYFRAYFVYKLGAPELNRLNHVEDFLFNQREGHCERFASTLALLLRMKGVPTRVMIGYLPSSRNWFSGSYNIRFSDAHAWTEAYFKDIGWVQLDATPAATGNRRRWPVRDLIETFDFIWYSNIVNFDAPTQQGLFALSLQFFSKLAEDLYSPSVIGPALVVLLLILWRRHRRQERGKPQRKRSPEQEEAIIAAEYYARMLTSLSRQGFKRKPQETPFEFVGQLQKGHSPVLPEAELVTGLFCASRYGTARLSPSQKAEIQEALNRIDTAARGKGRGRSSAAESLRFTE